MVKEINSEYALEGLMLKLKPQCFGRLKQSQLTGKAPGAGKDWRQKKKRAAEDDVVRYHPQLNGHKSDTNSSR